ncbi:MAG TPA: 6-phosphogluconolactonase [Gemmatimonadales bacterium]|jgi:6-phosphogluconolactonase|nr:6-phosphogluconolactonase [Gemmatimonadales bacterium]
MRDRIVVATSAELVGLAAEWLAREVTRAITERGSCALGLAGGRTPEPVYRQLAEESSIDWNRVDVFFSDERAVPPDDPESNFRMVSQALLTRVPIRADHIHRMEAERTDREAAARAYERSLPLRLDILILGMGRDGHTASLYPGSAALDERHRLVVPVVGPTPPAERLSITPPVIEAARTLAVIATGEDKAVMVARALEGPVVAKAVPAQLARGGFWFLDQAAAQRLADRRVTM